MREHRRQRRKAHAHSRCQAVDDGSPAGKPGGRRQCLCKPRRLRASRQRGSAGRPDGRDRGRLHLRQVQRERRPEARPEDAPRSGSPSPRRKPTRSGSPRRSPSRTRRASGASSSSRPTPSPISTRRSRDIQGMVDQGVQRADHLAAQLVRASIRRSTTPRSKNVPIMTIDRLLTTKTACEDYIGWVGSDFVEQGKRAADAMIAATGGKGKLAILLGAPGVNVTTDRNKGFDDEIAAKASEHGGRRRSRPANYERAKGQTVTEQLIQAHPDINGIYAHNDEMALGAVAALKAAGKQARRRQDRHDRRYQGRRPGHRRRLDHRRDRVQPALRPARLQGADGLLRRDRRPGQDHHLTRSTRRTTRERAGQRLLVLLVGTGPSDKGLLLGLRAGPDSCHYRPMRIG